MRYRHYSDEAFSSSSKTKWTAVKPFGSLRQRSKHRIFCGDMASTNLPSDNLAILEGWTIMWGGRLDLTRPKLYRSAFRPFFTLPDLLEADANLTFKRTPQWSFVRVASFVTQLITTGGECERLGVQLDNACLCTWEHTVNVLLVIVSTQPSSIILQEFDKSVPFARVTTGGSILDGVLFGCSADSPTTNSTRSHCPRLSKTFRTLVFPNTKQKSIALSRSNEVYSHSR